MLYVAVFAVNGEDPGARVSVFSRDGLRVELNGGGFYVEHSVPQVQTAPNRAVMSIGKARTQFPKHPHLVVTCAIRGPGHRRDGAWEARLRVAEAAALIELSTPAFLREKAFEGFINVGHETFWNPEGPLTLTAISPPSPEDFTALLETVYGGLGQVPEDERGRLQLAGRWFRRGIEAKNPIDKFLAWYVVLEVFPAKDTTDVPRAVRDFLHGEVYSDLDPGVVKGRCGIGRICRIRGEIVHKGKAFVGDSEEDDFDEKLRQLEAIARVCLRSLAGLPQGQELDRWVRPAE